MQLEKIVNEMYVIFNNVTNQLLQRLDIERIKFDPQNHLREMLSYYSLSTKPKQLIKLAITNTQWPNISISKLQKMVFKIVNFASWRDFKKNPNPKLRDFTCIYIIRILSRY